MKTHLMTETMDAIRVHDYGEPSVLQLEQVERPEPGEGQVLVRIKAAGVNPVDWKRRAGIYKQLMPVEFPWTPGLEGAGVVEAVGPGVQAFKAGQEVYGVIPASYAQYALAKEKDLQPKPSGLSFEEAASLPIGALTAWGAVIETAMVEAGQHVLVQGAAGGVGNYAVQLARWKEAYVVGTASAANVEFVRSLGAESAIDYNAVRFESVLHGLDAVIDTVGDDLVERSLKVLRPNGIYVTVAGRLPEDAGKAQNVRTARGGRATSDHLKDISRLIEAKQIRAVVGKIFPLTKARQAQELSQTRHGRGRIILRVS